jgi:ABC-type bacteriocin/lantibiotic exporter with double-glycine peptidase domain
VIAFAAVVGVIFMAALALKLTVLLTLMIIAMIGWWMSRRVRALDARSGCRHVGAGSENLNGIRTVQALVQEKTRSRASMP